MTSERRAFKGAEVVGKAMHPSKTRLAIESALDDEAEHPALLFVRADSPAVSAARACEEPQLSQVGLEPTAILENVGLPSVSIKAAHLETAC